MTDDADRPRAGTPGAEDEGARPEGPATQAYRWSPEAAAADYAEEAVARSSGWNLADEDDATQAFRWQEDDAAAASEHRAAGTSSTEPPAVDAQAPTEAIPAGAAGGPAVPPGGPAPRDPEGTHTAPTGIDALFRPGQFRDFEPTSVLPLEPRPVGATAIRKAGTRPSLTSGQRSLLWAAGVLVAVLVLLALFSIGRRLPALFAAPPAPVETATPTPTPTPEPVDPAAGPVQPGEYAWDELRGGECLEPYESAWQEDYTVVACDGPHAAQLLVRAEFPEDAAPSGAYPGFDELAGRINLLCTDPKAIDYGAAREYDDIVVEGAHAVTPEEWDEGHQDYFCFLRRSSGDPLTGTLAVPRKE